MTREIDKIVIHCSATPEGRDVKFDTIKDWHVKERGWSNIGYHFVVELDGTIVEGRPLESTGAHLRGFNKKSIGICYVGGLDSSMKPKDTRTEKQKESLDFLALNLLDTFKGAELCGHNEYSSKSCPSFNVKEEYKEIINLYN